jgi:hypothetical protein
MAEETQKVVELKFRITGVEIVKTQINPIQPGFTATDFQFTVNLETRIDPQKKLIIIIVTADIKADNNSELLGSIGAASIFTIENFDDVFKKVTDVTYDTPDNIMITLASISISTLRGIMFDQLRGTHLHGAILPIMDPKKFMVGEPQ